MAERGRRWQQRAFFRFERARPLQRPTCPNFDRGSPDDGCMEAHKISRIGRRGEESAREKILRFIPCDFASLRETVFMN